MYASIIPTVGLSSFLETFTPDTTQRFVAGMFAAGVDPFFGYGEFVYGKSAAAMNPGTLVYQSGSDFTMTAMPNTANLGRSVLVARQVFSAANQFGWFQRAGMAPMIANAAVAAGTSFGLTAAGGVGTNAAGKQILNATIVQTGTYAPTKANCMSTNGSSKLFVPNTDGLVYGLTASGTGISGTITGIDPSNNSITLSANATATGAITATFTWTNFVLVAFQNAFAQGAIT